MQEIITKTVKFEQVSSTEYKQRKWLEKMKSESEELYKLWASKYDVAYHNTYTNKNETGRVLIEVAAQHPLVDGCLPNEEFEKRLNLAMQLGKKLEEEGFDVFYYVPGSIHKTKGVCDSISLSKAGKIYLRSNGVASGKVFSDETNDKYMGEKGVYNSADECYVATQIFRDELFEQIHCVCSSGQMMRKVLYYINYGVIPYMHTVSTQDMFHNYIYELFRSIPDVLAGTSNVSNEKLREERRVN